MKKILTVMLLLLVTAALFASPVKEQTVSDYPISRIIVGTTSKIEKAERGEYAFDMLSSAVSELPLVSQDTSGEYHPLLAAFATEDGQNWTFTLRDGLVWSDGVPVTAEDILFTFLYEDENGSAYLHDQTDSNGKVTAAKYSACTVSEDNRSVTLTLPQVNVRMLSDMTSFRIMPKHVYEGNNAVTAEDNRIGCGPYRFSSFSPESGTIVFTADENWIEKVNVQEVVYRLFSNEDTMYLALESGDIDMVWNYSMGTPAAYQDFLKTSNNVTLVSVPAANLPAVLAFNNSKGPFADENLRQAVSYALDPEVFKSYFGSEFASVPSRGVVPTTTVGYTETEKLSKDWAKADEFMQAAGYTRGSDGRFAFSFSLTVNASKQTHLAYAELVKNQLDEYGIDVVIDAVDGASYNAKTSNKFSGNNITMEAAIYGYTAAGMGMGNGLGTIYVDKNHAVQGGCQVDDEAFSAALDALSGAKTIEEYYAGAALVQDYYASHAPLIALYWDSQILAHSSSLDNVTADAVFGLNSASQWTSVTKH